MKFEKKTPVVLVKKDPLPREGKKPLNFVSIADPETYENIKMLCSNTVDYSALVEKKKYNLSIEYDGRYANAIFEEIK